MWIARDKNKSLWLYKEKPIRNEQENYWISSHHDDAISTLYPTMFPELKWEDEPIEVEIISKGKSNKTNITVTREKIAFDDSYWTAFRHMAAMAAMQSMITNWPHELKPVPENVCSSSVDFADALIEKLKSKQEKNVGSERQK